MFFYNNISIEKDNKIIYNMYLSLDQYNNIKKTVLIKTKDNKYKKKNLKIITKQLKKSYIQKKK